MNASLRALLSGVIDYAGLFPPAQLPLQETLNNYAAYRASPDAWLLGHFICPAAKLKDLDDFPPLSVVGRGGTTLTDFMRGIPQDLTDMSDLCRGQPSAVIDAYETRVSTELVHRERAKDLHKVMDGPARLMADEPIALNSTYYEVEYGAGWTALVDSLVSALDASREPPRKGLKIRCSGATAASVPSSADIAFALAACRQACVPVKFTAGLHHPLRRDESTLGTKTHGFLNVFVAGVLGHARGSDAGVLEAIIEDEDPKHFHFDDDGLRWKALQATTEEIAAAREKAVISFGSCSFDEPREDLRALGLMR
jgi:hypothetical protein